MERLGKQQKGRKFNDPFKSESAEVQTHQLCKDKGCPRSKNKHRHSTRGCGGHYLCAEPPMQGLDGSQGPIPESMPMYGVRELKEIDKNIKAALFENGIRGGKYLGYEQLRERNNSEGYFGRGEPLPPDRKLVITDEVIDNWLAAHWDLTLDKIPRSCPTTIPKSVYSKLSKQRRLLQARFSGAEKSFEAQKRRRSNTAGGVESDDGVQSPAGFAKDPPYQASPKKHKMITYPKDFDIQSLVGQQHAAKAMEDQRKAAGSQGKRSTAERLSAQQPLKSPFGSPDAQSPGQAHKASKAAEMRKTLSVVVVGKAAAPDAKAIDDSVIEGTETQPTYKQKTQAQNQFGSLPSKIYSQPNEFIRKRINSEYLTFMNYLEIEKFAQKLDDQAMGRDQPKTPAKAPAQPTSGEQQKKAKDFGKIYHGVQSKLTSPKAAARAASKAALSAQGPPEKQEQAKITPEEPIIQPQPAENKSKKEAGSRPASSHVIKFQQNNQALSDMEKIKNQLYFKQLANVKDEPTAKNQTRSPKAPPKLPCRYAYQIPKKSRGTSKRIQSGNVKFTSSLKYDNKNQTQQIESMRDIFSVDHLNQDPLDETISSIKNMAHNYLDVTLNVNQNQRTSLEMEMYKNMSRTRKRRGHSTAKQQSAAGLAQKAKGSAENSQMNIHDYSTKQESTKALSGAMASGHQLAQRGRTATSSAAFLSGAANSKESYQHLTISQKSNTKEGPILYQDQAPSLERARARLYAESSPNVVTRVPAQDYQRAVKARKEQAKTADKVGPRQKRAHLKSAAPGNRSQRRMANDYSQMFKDQFSTQRRIRNEQVTSNILREQDKLQRILSNSYSLRVPAVDLPTYTKIDLMKTQANPAKYPGSVFSGATSIQQIRKGDQSMDAAELGEPQPVSPGVISGSTQYMTDHKKVAGSHPLFPRNTQSSQQASKDQHDENELQYSYVDILNQFGLNSSTALNVTEKNASMSLFNGSERVNFKKDAKSANYLSGQAAQANESQGESGKPLSAFDELRRKNTQELRQKILSELNNSIESKTAGKAGDGLGVGSDGPCTQINVDIKLITLDLRKTQYFEEFKDYRFWIQQSQLNKASPNDWESALDYLASGLREIPLSIQLLYNYAVISEKLGRYAVALKFFDFCKEIRPRWTDALFGQAVIHFKLGRFTESKDCVKVAIHKYKDDSHERIEVMQYFQAMCYKNLHKFRKANRDYSTLLSIFKSNISESVLNHVVTAMLLPLKDSRKEQLEFLENTVSLVNFLHPVLPQLDKDKLSNYIDPETKCIDVKNYELFIWRVLRKKPFFRRFSRPVLMRFMGKAQVGYYKKEEILFLQDQIGVITHGSIKVISHDQGIMTPVLIGRYKQGRILGHGESDGNITLNPQTWFTTEDDGTEIVFFKREDFNQLWSLQCLNTQRFMLNQILSKNLIWKQLSLQTQLHLIFEHMELRKFRPGELICRMSKRSALNTKIYGKYYQSAACALKDEMEVAKVMETVDLGDGGDQAGGPKQTLMTNYVKQLTTKKPEQTIPRWTQVDKAIVDQVFTPTSHGSDSAGSPARTLTATIQTSLTDTAREAASRTSTEALVAEQMKQNLKLADKSAQKTARRIQRQLKKQKDTLPFEEILHKLNFMFKDHKYKEVDGLYIIYQGYVDIVDPRQRECLYSITQNDLFGDAKILKQSGYEYYGDLYAGLYPRPEILRNPQLAKKSREGGAGDSMLDLKDKLRDKMRSEMKVKNIIEVGQTSRNKLMEILSGKEDCVLTLFIPYQTLYDIVPSFEMEKIRESQELRHRRAGVLNNIASKKDLEFHDLNRY